MPHTYTYRGVLHSFDTSTPKYQAKQLVIAIETLSNAMDSAQQIFEKIVLLHHAQTTFATQNMALERA